MIKKFIDKLFGKSDSTEPGAKRVKKSPFGQRQDVTVKEHGIDVSLVDDRAMDVVRTLKDAGYEAYIVGGAVRDLLVGLRPKDFDVATDATPEQVKSLFRRAFIIGRRFRIVHVIYGRGREHEVIEVSTFRAHLDSSLAEQVGGNERTSKSELAGMKHAVDASGRVLRDNVWGPIEQDAARRDFTINAMYYDPETQVVVDYHNGIKDAKKKIIRMIGDPAVRYREDPVRIIRAVRFAAKLSALGFKFEDKTVAPLREMKGLLADVPQSRLFDEMLKLLQTGHALASIAQLKFLGLGTGIYPLLDVVVENADEPFLKLALQDTDRRVGEGKPVAPSFLLSCVLWFDVREGWERRKKRGEHLMPALQDAIDDAFNAKIGDVSGRGKLGTDMREIWTMQPRFEKRVGSAPYSLLDQPRFRAGFDFLRLRAQTGEIEMELAEWWEKFSTAYDDERHAMIEEARQAQQNKPQAPRVRVKRPDAEPGSANAERTTPDAADASGEQGDAAPAKKRRRRRKPANRGGAGGAEGAGGEAAASPSSDSTHNS
ncbi:MULTISPECIES: polynucleotide adenylyltransferase PcnB [unclassified Polaromonas]|uniref:polynucleotide adenylyltransferase PcnB n=1 Tax=unclassified Polaromonas TaxID=2638319 RepID=UPI000F086318|nr:MULTISPECIES: polynucleotide adenylyltransferase PcnB [unclassified Polaromonas]AYQ28795.1 polynucleotide adenylyltransferase PcnB [Polaromonas sp. SP1]QGJ20090.1 polynucleotide adenylyltransferase PcnB [Polaromonas sp. Pch-P]